MHILSRPRAFFLLSDAMIKLSSLTDLTQLGSVNLEWFIQNISCKSLLDLSGLGCPWSQDDRLSARPPCSRNETRSCHQSPRLCRLKTLQQMRLRSQLY